MRSLLLILALAAVSPAATIQLEITPFGSLSAVPGAFAGAGYLLEDDRGFAVPTLSEFSPDPDSSQFLDSSLYVDFVSLPQNFVVVAPGDLAGQDFDATQQTGAGEIFVFPSAPPGSTLHGVITVQYDLYSKDPNIDPSSFLLGDNLVSADVTIQVPGDVTAAPEPGTLALLATAIVLLVAGKLGRRRRAGIP